MVSKNLRVVFLYFGFLFLCTSSISAQNFTYKTTIRPVKDKSYYQIKLIPQVVGRCQLGLQDLRIKDENGKEVPYLFQTGESSVQSENYRVLTLLSTTSTKGSTIYVTDGLNSKGDRPLVLKIANADVEKSLRFEGSNNKIEWFVIQSVLLNPFYLGGDSVKEGIISLPTTNHRYLRCTVDDSTTGKIDIKSFGYKDLKINKINNFEIPQATYSQVDIDSNKTSIIDIHFNQSYLVNQLSVDIKQDWDFYREVKVETLVSSAKSGNYYQVIQQGRFASYFDQNILQTQDLITKKLRLTIYNKDNPPIKVTGIKAFQKPIWLIAPLESYKPYALFYGDDKLAAPEYDLQYFEQKLAQDLPRARLESIIKMPFKEQQVKNNGSLNNYYIAACIFLVTVLLLFMTWKMMKELKVNVEN